ncbi:MAG: Signal transduction histidine-protein kinase BaeS [bacterium ADurb.Bin243]|nr:MAG: Signal transduction histidine-protein kinase BaeS [bacterium ADurb.Bin243]
MFKYKVALITLATSLFCVILSGGIMAVSVASFFLELLREDIVYQTSKIASVFNETGIPEGAAADEFLKKTPVFINASAGIYGSDFNFISDSALTPDAKYMPRLSEYDRKSLMEGKTITGVFAGQTPADRRFFCSAPIFSGGVFKGGVISFVNFHTSEQRRKKLQKKIFVSLVISLFASAFIGLFLAKWLLKPLGRIYNAAASYSAGDFSPRIGIKSSDDIGRIAATLNEMAGKIEGLLKSQRDFLADASHEFKTPLTSIRGAGEAIADGVVSGEEEIKRYAARIVEETNYLSELVSDILELSKLESGAAVIETYPVDMAAVFYKTFARYDEQIKKKNIKIETNFAAAESIEVMAEDKRITKAVKNLFENAVLHSPENAVISVKVMETPLENTAPPSEKAPPGKELYLFEISNMGEGIPEDEREKVFRRFYRLDRHMSRTAGGSGLGLAICRQTVQAFGGVVEFCDPEPGFGVRVCFTLKKARSPQQ